MNTLKVELPYVIERTGILSVMYYAHLVGFTVCGESCKTKAAAVKSLKKAVREHEKILLDGYAKRDEAGVSLPKK